MSKFWKEMPLMSLLFIRSFNLIVFISCNKSSSSDNPTHTCLRHSWNVWPWLKETDNLPHYWRHHRHIHLKEKESVLLVYRFRNFVYQKFISALIHIYGGWWLRRLPVFENKLGEDAQYERPLIRTQIT